LLDFSIRPLKRAERSWVDQAIRTEWGAPTIAVHQMLYLPSELPGFVAEQGGQKAGLATYHIDGRSCEIVSLNSWREGQGIGTALIEAVKRICRQKNCRRLWLVTTNDNTPALLFYQRRGFTIAAIYIGAVEADRRLKPEIPLTGIDGIPIRDEIELEIHLPGHRA